MKLLLLTIITFVSLSAEVIIVCKPVGDDKGCHPVIVYNKGA